MRVRTCDYTVIIITSKNSNGTLDFGPIARATGLLSINLYKLYFLQKKMIKTYWLERKGETYQEKQEKSILTDRPQISPLFLYLELPLVGA